MTAGAETNPAAHGGAGGATGVEEARRRIADAKRTGAEELDIGGLGLEEVPEELFELTQLKVLYLGLPKAAAEKPYWRRTREDRETRNAVRALPPALFTSLHCLTQLNLEHNRLVRLPDTIAQAIQLRSLDLSGNSIGAEGARRLSSLTGLTMLDLSDNGIGTDGARHLPSLTGLATLDLSRNAIWAEGARHLSSLIGLATLDLSGNGIGAEGARHLSSLTGLTTLDLRDNNIGAGGVGALLDVWIARTEAARFQRLHLDGASAKKLQLPSEVIESGDAQAIFAAWRAFRRAKLKPLNEAKMLVVGHEAVGKTSLIRYLVHNKPRDPDERKTRIEIHDWQPEGADGVKLNVWDFGGQEMMHGTHRYFLTARSLYLVVLQDRTEDDKSVYEWLRTIKSRGGDAPVLVVINKSDNGKDALKLNEPGLRRDYPNIAGFLRTSCDDDAWSMESVKALREKSSRC